MNCNDGRAQYALGALSTMWAMVNHCFCACGCLLRRYQTGSLFIRPGQVWSNEIGQGSQSVLRPVRSLVLPWEITEHKNDIFSRKQHIVFWMNNVDQYFTYTLSSFNLSTLSVRKLITSAQNFIPVHARTSSVAVSTDWQPSQWQFAANHPTLQQGAASARRRYLHGSYIHAAAWLPRSCNRRGLDLDCLAAKGHDRHFSGFQRFHQFRSQ